jgi:hypothetical protein
MFAKYLKAMGHDVTVIRSGEFSKKPDDSLTYDDMGISVYSFLGSNSPAEKYARGELARNANEHRSRIWFLPYRLRKNVSRIYRFVESPIRFVRRINDAKRKFQLQKVLIDHLRPEQFDVVFSSYGELENIFAGKYAAKIFECKLVLDFRDLIAQHSACSFLEYRLLRLVQRKAVQSSDVCTAVSRGLAAELSTQAKGKKVITLYNGYEELKTFEVSHIDVDILSFCYTGGLYAGKRDASALFEAIGLLEQRKEIQLDKIRFNYAGNDFEELRRQAVKYGVERILVDHGYIDRKHVSELQRQDDFFVVLSWNTIKEQGILTGKLYEALRAKKPISALVSGTEPNSEIRELI